MKREVAILAGLLALTCALRLPFMQDIGPDEAFFAVIGRDWAQGAPPYAEYFDVKPPGLFLLHALMAPLFGAGAGAIKGLEIAFVTASAYGLWRIGRAHLSEAVGLAAAALYPIVTLSMSGLTVSAPLALSGFEVFAVFAALGGRIALAGLLFGCAFAIKQTAAIEAAAVLAALLAQAPGRERIGVCARFIGGCIVAPAGFALYFLAAGAFPAFWSAVAVAASTRLGGDGVGFFESLVRIPVGMRPMLAPAVGALLLALRFRQWAGEPCAPALRLLFAWLAGALLALLAMRAMYDHYFLPLTGPLLLLAGYAAFHLLDFGAWRREARAGLVLVTVLCPVVLGAPEPGDADDRAALLGVEARARVAGLRPGDVALAVNRGVMFYSDTGTRPPRRIFHPLHMLCDMPAWPGDHLAAALAARPKFVLLADTRIRMACEKPERLAALRTALDSDYELVARASGAWDAYAVYRLK
jgi:hypothetical protein